MNAAKVEKLRDVLLSYNMSLIEVKIVVRYGDRYEEIPFRLVNGVLQELSHFHTDDVEVMAGGYDPWTTGVERLLEGELS